MNTTRRDTLKSILAATAVAAVPAVVEAAIAAKPPTKAESIYAKIKELISKCEKERDLPFDPQRDIIEIYLPASFNRCDIDATTKCFLREYPTCRWFGFKSFKTFNGLTVDIDRVVDADDMGELHEIYPAFGTWSYMRFEDGKVSETLSSLVNP